MKRMRRLLGRSILVLLLLIDSLFAYVKLTHGSGDAYPDRSTAPLFGPDAVTIAATLPLPPSSVAVNRGGRIFFNYHYLGGKDAAGHSVFELLDGRPVPYPSVEFQTNFKTTLGMLIDSQNRLWIIEPAGLDGDRRTRLLAFDVATNTVVYDYTFPDAAADFAQDLQVSRDGRMVYLASTVSSGSLRPT